MIVRHCFSTALPTLRTTWAPAWTRIKPGLDLYRQSKAFLGTESSMRLTKPKPLREWIPSGSWDSHMHVTDKKYPVVEGAPYFSKPDQKLDDAMAFESSLRIQNIVLVQPSIYGTNNSCLLEALRHIGPYHGRGVVDIDPLETKRPTLRKWHALGVRGVRVNFMSKGMTPSHQQLDNALSKRAELIRELGWMIQIHTPMSTMSHLEDIIPKLGVKVCIDHFGCPDLPKVDWEQGQYFDPYLLRGFPSLMALLHRGNTWVKVSAPYRFSKDINLRDIDVMAREFIREVPHRVLYATDWPHTRFRNIDIEPFTEMILRRCGSWAVAKRVFRYNAEDLMNCRLDI
ncbi:putative TIM barrel metal-dependent hydrolase [Aspergillus mulundensis]|uniref:Amidohydrolase-related domain-containing protein n=1 Tax=Aspergillus mulundensis TaxID=1810919 RepID=A0A3D8SV69_9EURO|nr:hypothetical protein DSM5745_01988 [Aspergillus mulundensis]RDW90213.1 hypothetical protein DSM5745_01988 [Aspergillus mulundensis]